MSVPVRVTRVDEGGLRPTRVTRVRTEWIYLVPTRVTTGGAEFANARQRPRAASTPRLSPVRELVANR